MDLGDRRAFVGLGRMEASLRSVTGPSQSENNVSVIYQSFSSCCLHKVSCSRANL